VSDYAADSLAHCKTLNPHYLDQPHEIALETIAQCNAACTFCPYPTLERIGTKMPDELIESVIDQMADFQAPFYFSPFKVNEPLLDKRLYDICKAATARTPCILRIFTNGSPLTPSHIDRLAELDRVAHVWVSLNETDPEKYKALMNLDFERTATRLDKLHEREDFPHPVVLSTVGRPNLNFEWYCTQRWPRFQVVCIERSGWLGYTDPQTDVIPDAPCSRWWELSITAEGVCSLCCMDGEGDYSIGNIRDDRLVDIYARLRQRREGLESRHNHHPCSTCTY